jgi:hypothetical protein
VGDEVVPTPALQPHIPMTKKLALLGVLLFAAVAPSAEAQRQRGSRPIEFGIDGGILFGLDDPNVTVIALPLQVFRVGFLMSEKVSIEPTMALTSFRGDGGSSTDYTFGVGLLYSPGGDRVGKGLYGRPFVGLSGRNSSGPNDDSNAFVGLGVGLKIPFADRRLATRMEANYSHAFSDPGTNVIGLIIGLSFFTR